MEPLVALNCSTLSSTLLSSTRGGLKPFSEGGLELDSTLLSLARERWNPFSEGGLEREKLPDTELMPTAVRGMLLGLVEWDSF